jgi:voltage-gated potassium channel
MIDAPDPSAVEDDHERRAERLEDRLDLPMAALAVVWVLLVAYDLSGAATGRGAVLVAIDVIWVVFVVEFVVKLVVSRRPGAFLARRWPALLFLTLPALRMLRVVRLLRALPVARVAGSSYRAIGTARSVLGGRLGVLVATTFVVIFSGSQLAMLLEPTIATSLGEGIWWAGNVGITGNLVAEPVTLPGRILSLVLSTYAVVVVAALAAALGAFFLGGGDDAAEDAERVSDVDHPGT